MLLFVFAVFIGANLSFGLDSSSADMSLSWAISIPHFDFRSLKEVLMKLLSKTVEVVGHIGGARPERRPMQSGIWSRVQIQRLLHYSQALSKIFQFTGKFPKKSYSQPMALPNKGL